MLPISCAVSHCGVLFLVCQRINASLLPQWRTVGCWAGWLVGEWGLSCESFCLVFKQLFILLLLVSGALWVFCYKSCCLLAVLVSSLDLSFYSSVILLWLFHLVSASNMLLLLSSLLIFLPLWVYALKHNTPKQACFVHTPKQAASAYFQSPIFSWEIILSFQIFIITITNIHCTKLWNI